ncbi:MAG: metallophosphoesterase [Gemmatimonadetes bacterium]|nr:metallophosphoesterase [Gemmatimonadota bacterium]MDA1102550.1 metallophosphoesterase [Gemmatimonadota bacterium]
MIVAHLSDLHLGFRAYGRVERGTDMRERDVAAAFDRASQEVVRLRPDVVIIAGDVFDRPDPPASAVVALARGLEALRVALPHTPVLMVAGPRDTPRRPGDPGALAVLDTFPNVEAATGLTRSILIERLSLHASLVPYRAVTRHPPALPDPDPRMRWNILALHAEAPRGGEGGILVDPSEWDYIALGGEHRRTKLSDRVRYPGSLERVALDPWDEAADEKGFLTIELESGRVSFHAIPGRPVVALAPVKVGHGDPDRLRRRVREVTGEVPGGIADKIVRLRLQGAAPADLLALQGDPLRTLRSEALHIAVEAGRDLRIPAEAWSPVDAPRLMRESVLAELGRSGTGSADTERIVQGLIPDRGTEDEAHGVVEALDGVLPGLGRVSTSIPMGLTAVLGGGGRARRAVADLYLEAGRTGPDGAIARWWAGADSETLDGALRRAIDAVAESRGLGLVDAALEALGAHAPSVEPASPPPAPPRRGAVRVDPEQVAAEFRTAERELLSSRADVTEVDGDLEVATMDWHRERQDAETTLYAYRDRAREVRGRIRTMEASGPEAPCPTCGRVLDSHYQEVLTELRDEWESVVQDGGWWRSRWEQLEPKPVHLQELERTSFRLHAALEAGSERLELLRARLQELDGSRATTDPPREGPEGDVISALTRVRAARLTRATDVLLDRASRFVSRISGGRILAMTWDGGVAHLQGSEGVLLPLAEEDLAAGRIAIRLAAASLIGAKGRIVASLPLEQPFDRLDEEARIRTLVLAKSLLREIPRVVLFSRGDAVDARPELFDYVLEVSEEGSLAGPVLRPAPAGPGRLALKSPVGSTAAKIKGP